MFPDTLYCRSKEQLKPTHGLLSLHSSLSLTFPCYLCYLEIRVSVQGFVVQVYSQLVVLTLPNARGLLVRPEFKKSVQIQH